MKHILFLLVSLAVIPGLAQPSHPKTNNEAGAVTQTGRSCTFDFERPEVPNCIHERNSGQLFIAPRYIPELPFNDHGLAPVLSDTNEWMYVNRKGDVVVIGVVWMDNGPDGFHGGLARVLRNGKYGFVNRKGKLAIPAIYDGAFTFEGGTAVVCKGCRTKCDESKEHCSFVGGQWLSIDRRGRVLGSVNPDSYR